MNAREALTYLERVVEDRADINPEIHGVVEVLSETVDRVRALEKTLCALLEWCEIGEIMPGDTFIKRYNEALKLIYPEGVEGADNQV